MPPILNVIVLAVLGAAALFLGYRLFWLFASVVGFALGWWLVGLIFSPGWLQLISGVVVGLIMALLTRVLGKWAIRIVAAMAGFVMLPYLLGLLSMMGTISTWLWSLLGAAVGFALGWVMARWTIIFLSALLGATLITNGLGSLLRISEAVNLILVFALTAVGVFFQARQPEH